MVLSYTNWQLLVFKYMRKWFCIKSMRNIKAMTLYDIFSNSKYFNTYKDIIWQNFRFVEIVA